MSDPRSNDPREAWPFKPMPGPSLNESVPWWLVLAMFVVLGLLMVVAVVR